MLRKHSLTINGHATSITLEPEFWDALGTIADGQKIALAALVAQIDSTRGDQNLSSAIRVFVLKQALS